MAKALYSKGQRVFVKPVGVWATIDRILPQWVKGVEEPLKIFYDVGLGREFTPDELQAETEMSSTTEDGDQWRVTRARNKWQSDTETASHPYPGTHPVVVTGESDWGGWRVPGAEYALSPVRIERQARMIEKSAPSRREFDAARSSFQELDAHFQLQIADLPAQRRLGGMQPSLGSVSKAAFLGHSDEVA